ncbi:MAG: DEAD/DEAH box helicase family protein [Bacteroidaceae bacterium]|nr:DEAD/DEAH box helicase family protein [Bacteroidaceae bacterium]
MFYKLIEKKRDEWLASDRCTVLDLLAYIRQRGMMRDAQLEAIKTYLYLKIACQNQPLWALFVAGTFNDTDIGSVELTETARQIFAVNKAAVALFQYSRLKDKNGRQLAPELEKFIKRNADKIDYEATFKKIFYDVDYTDYLFSLPMGAGKTYLMAAFIYLDLYFAQNEPDNPSFAHNFMVMAPSGLKSSIVPSLRHIREFDPSWIIPEPRAAQLRQLVKFETLDEQKTANKSNLVKNPNAQKINNHQPLEDLMGLVAITNAEKVILDHYEESLMPLFVSQQEWYKVHRANELRDIIGKIPHLAVYIDEVHHAADGDIKLRRVVNGWTRQNTFNSVLGFSGTPYLDSAENVTLAGEFTIRNTDLSNVVYYYPLIDGIGNFLKEPCVRLADNDTETIVLNGVRDFLDAYKDTRYENGTCAKLAVYCGQIATLEGSIYPLVAETVSSYGLNPTEVILKYHGGNKEYPKPEGADQTFALLDTPFSVVKIVLLVQIGKEGWDCKSLTGVVLPQKGVCPTNMVLQTSCRCLRQVVRDSRETALIWLNKYNADTLNKQLKKQQDITLKEFGTPRGGHQRVERFSRMERQQLPPIDFYQLRVSYETLIVEESCKPAQRLQEEGVLARADIDLIHQQDLEGRIVEIYEQENQEETPVSFRWWLHQIAKESFGTLSVEELKTCEKELVDIFGKITIEKDGLLLENKQYDHPQVRSLIRRAFADVRDYEVREEVLPCKANLLQIEKLVSPVEDDGRFYPSRPEVKEILQWDENPPLQEQRPEVLRLLEQLKAMGQDVSAIHPQKDPHPERTQTYHYLPYHFDSGLERDFFSQEIVPLIRAIKDQQLEVYFNGDDTLTEFSVNCYSQRGRHWEYIGKYYPDYLVLSRDGQQNIDKVIIVETKGEGYAAKFAERKHFMETEFVEKNNEKFGYERFDFLYLEDTLAPDERRRKALSAIKKFFNV